VAEFVLGDLCSTQANADTQEQIALAVSGQRRFANRERGRKALARVGEKAQQRAVFPYHRYKIVRGRVCRSIGEQALEILCQADLIEDRLCVVIGDFENHQATDHIPMGGLIVVSGCGGESSPFLVGNLYGSC
jgi:hypothetical protein